MKVTNCLIIFLTMAFALSILTFSDAGQQGMVISPGTGKPTVKKEKSELAPKNVVPKKEEKKAGPVPKKTDHGIPSTTPKITTDQPKVTMPAPKSNIVVQSFSYTVPQGRSANEPFKEGEGTTLSISFRNTGNAKSNKNHKYTIVCVLKSGGPECPVPSQTKTFGKEIAPNSAHLVLLSVELKKAGNYYVTAKVAGERTFSQKTVKLRVVPAPKLEIGEQVQKPALPVTTQVYPRAGIVTDFGKGELKAQKKATAPQLDTTKQKLGTKSKLSNTMKFKTHLSVKLQGKDFTQWGDSWAGSAPEVLKFRWKTVKGANPIPGKWQVSTRAPFIPILKEGDAGIFPGPGEYLWFYIDFKNIASLAPGRTQFLVRVVPETASALYAPSPPVLVKIDAPESDTVFNFPPKINQTMGEPGGAYYFSPDGRLYLYGIDFGAKKGSIIIYGMGFPDGKLELNQVVWESNSRVNGRVPVVTGIKDQKVKIEVVTHDGLVSNRVEHWFRATRERRKLKCGDPAVTVDRCSMQANSNDCVCKEIGSGPAIYGYHRNNVATTSNDVGKDTFKIELKNGWTIFHGEFGTIYASSDDEKVFDPTPQWTPSMSTWRPTFEWVVSPGDRLQYHYKVTIEGPKGVPHY